MAGVRSQVLGEPTWQPQRWRGPRFGQLGELLARLAGFEAWPTVADLDQVWRAELAVAGVRLIEERKPGSRRRRVLDVAELYEVRIADRGEVPTRRANLHDLFNALIWAAFPHAKRALTERVASLQRQRGTGVDQLPPSRSRDHDRLALLDEGGVVVTTTQLSEDAEAYRAALGAGEACAMIFGHAILEHAAKGADEVRVALCPVVVDQVTGEVSRAAVDEALAAVLRRGQLTLCHPGVVLDEEWLARRTHESS